MPETVSRGALFILDAFVAENRLRLNWQESPSKNQKYNNSVNLRKHFNCIYSWLYNEVNLNKSTVSIKTLNKILFLKAFQCIAVPS